MNITYHYPPDLFNLLVDTIPLLCKSKKDVLIFFKGAGVPTNMMEDMISKVNYSEIWYKSHQYFEPDRVGNR
jgi:hypothetical protein